MSPIYYNHTQSSNIIKEDPLIIIIIMKILLFYFFSKMVETSFLYEAYFFVFQYNIIKFSSIIKWHNVFYVFQFMQFY